MNASDHLVCELRQSKNIKLDIKKEKTEQKQKQADAKKTKEAKGRRESKDQ